jgi:hypothetical protein
LSTFFETHCEKAGVATKNAARRKRIFFMTVYLLVKLNRDLGVKK